MTTLAEFLAARIDEDEAAAKAAAGRGTAEWHVPVDAYPVIPGRLASGVPGSSTYDPGKPELPSYPGSGEVLDADGDHVVYDEGVPTREEAAHIVRHDPARVLREVEAKRAILAEYDAALAAQNSMLATPAGDQHVTDWENGRGIAAYNALRGFAAVYSGHPEYRQEWAR